MGVVVMKWSGWLLGRRWWKSWQCKRNLRWRGRRGDWLWWFLSSARRWVDEGGSVVVVHNGSEVVVAKEVARREDEDDNGKKNGGKADFSSTLAFNFLMLRT